VLGLGFISAVKEATEALMLQDRTKARYFTTTVQMPMKR